ncbi:9450_t:CDS:2 [Cetraspora pellucida]|uniref:9450_t:CDS:1 n=1 Tax=Cetraspora pellucida TaxID=1433469 RepID=A0A9N9F7D0_9GLOM|nr:9450_t:CDS:2 [Cetraspora pellucida]
MILLHERHTSNYITEKILDIISFYNIDSQIISATTDNASSIEVFGYMFHKKLCYEYGNKDFEHVCYVAHVLNLTVSEGMKVVVNSIIKLRNFISYICKSQLLFEELKKVFQANRKFFLITDLDNNSALRDWYLNEAEWHKAIVILLKPIARAMPILSSSTCPII